MCSTHAWHAVVRASEALDALKDAIFLVEEQRQAHIGIWEARTEASPGRLLLALDDARDRLVKARDRAEEACNMQPASEETSKLSKMRADIYAEFVRIHAEALDLELTLESDRALLVLYDVCVQCERHMSNLEATFSRDSEDSEAMRVKSTTRFTPVRDSWPRYDNPLSQMIMSSREYHGSRSGGIDYGNNLAS